MTFLMLLAAAASLAAVTVLADSASPVRAAGELGDLAAVVPEQFAAVVHPLSPAPSATSQPERLSWPTTQAQGSQISFLLTRSLPEFLRTRHLLAMRELSPTDRDLVEIHSILYDSKVTLEAVIIAKKEFERKSGDVKDRYREKAQLIEKVLSTLTKEERARLLSLTPKERAKRIMELAAEINAKAVREGANPTGNSTPSTPR